MNLIVSIFVFSSSESTMIRSFSFSSSTILFVAISNYKYAVKKNKLGKNHKILQVDH